MCNSVGSRPRIGAAAAPPQAKAVPNSIGSPTRFPVRGRAAFQSVHKSCDSRWMHVFLNRLFPFRKVCDSRWWWTFFCQDVKEIGAGLRDHGCLAVGSRVVILEK